MRWLCAVLIFLTCLGSAAAEIRIEVSRYSNGELTISGRTAPLRTVTIDNNYRTQSDGEGTFKAQYQTV